MTNELAPKDDVLAALEAAFAGIAPPPPEGFCEWYLRIMAECDAVAERIQQQAEVMLREVETRKKSIQYFKGQEFRQRILAMLEANGGTKKSINLLTGKAGLRKL